MREMQREKMRTEHRISKQKVFWVKQNARMKEELTRYDNVTEYLRRKAELPIFMPLEQLRKIASKACQVWTSFVALDLPENFAHSKIKTLSVFEPELHALFTHRGRVIDKPIPLDNF